jgi:hypothetical protein
MIWDGDGLSFEQKERIKKYEKRGKKSQSLKRIILLYIYKLIIKQLKK